jgi:hypothetical protein
MYKLSSKNLNLMMEEIYTDLDVPLELKKEAETKYLNLGEWLNQDSQSKFKSDSQLY